MKDKTIPKLTPTQDHTLKLLYKFRFVTTHTLANYKQHKDIKSTYKLLEKLKDYGYVIKRYDKLAKINRKSAIYSLSKEGIKYLRDKYSLSESALHAMYKNNSSSEAFANLHIDILKVCNALRESYPNEIDVFTKNELIDQDYFPEPRPDLYIRKRELVFKESNEFFLYMINEVQLFAIKKKLRPVLDHYENEGWDGDYPTLLFVCSTQSIETRLRAYLVSLELDDELRILTSTKQGLTLGIDKEAWMDYRTDQVLISI